MVLTRSSDGLCRYKYSCWYLWFWSVCLLFCWASRGPVVVGLCGVLWWWMGLGLCSRPHFFGSCDFFGALGGRGTTSRRSTDMTWMWLLLLAVFLFLFECNMDVMYKEYLYKRRAVWVIYMMSDWVQLPQGVSGSPHIQNREWKRQKIHLKWSVCNECEAAGRRNSGGEQLLLDRTGSVFVFTL